MSSPAGLMLRPQAEEVQPMPALTGETPVACFAALSVLPDKAQWTHRHILARLPGLPGPCDPLLTQACAALAAAIDAQAERFDGKPYHNRQHFCEVALTAFALCALGRVAAASAQLVVLAALVHDLVHEAGAHPACSQERASVACALGLLAEPALPAPLLARLSALVLATDMKAGTPYVAAVCKAPGRDAARAVAVPAAAPELAALAEDPALAALARLLCEADVLPSIGLTLAHALRLQACLAREWGRSLGREDKLQFIDDVLQRRYIGHLFLPQIHAIRERVSQGEHASGQG